MLVDADLVNIHCGNGAERAAAGDMVQQLAEYLGCAVTNTIRARGIISDEHPLCFHPTCLSRIMANSQADVVLAVGTRLGRVEYVGAAADVGGSANPAADSNRYRTHQHRFESAGGRASHSETPGSFYPACWMP